MPKDKEKKLRAYVLRHGTTELNKDNRFRGLIDVDLDEKGVLDANKAAEFLADKNDVERIICSPLLRTVHTAEIVAGRLGGRCIEQDRGLFTWENFVLYGKDKDEFNDVLEDLVNHPEKTPKFGESLNAFGKRIGDFFEQKLKIPVITLFVTHNSVVMTLCQLIEGKPINNPEKGESVQPGGIIAIYEDGDDGYSFELIFKKDKEAEFGS